MDKPIDRHLIRRKRMLLYLIPASVLLLVVLLIIIGGRSAGSFSVERSALRFENVSFGTFSEDIIVDGTVMPLRTIFLDAVEAGRIEEKFAEEGDLVEAGQALLRLSNPDLQLEMMNREDLLFNEKTNFRNALFNRDKTLMSLQEELELVSYELEKARQKFQQDSMLFVRKVLPENDYQLSRTERNYLESKKNNLVKRISREELQSNDQINHFTEAVGLKSRNLELVKKTLDMLILRAPAKGQLTAFRAEVGEYKNKGQNLGQLDILDGYKVRAGIDEHYLSRISQGQDASFEFDGTEHPMKIQVVYPQVSNGRFEADLIFKSKPAQGIRKGQSVQVRLQLGGLSSALQVPKGAFYQSTGGHWAFVLTEDKNKAVKRKIRIGRQSQNSYEVLDGLKAGETIIVSSYDSFGDHEQINLKN